MEAAENIFIESVYSNLVMEMQELDLNKSFINSTAFGPSNLNTIQKTGINRGLLVVLDSHSDLYADRSLDSDDNGYTVAINPSGTFPLTSYTGFDIKPGHENFIAISGTVVKSDEGLRSIEKASRNCLFEDENRDMKIFKNYTQSNCLLECSLFYAYEMQLCDCVPWYLPSPGNFTPICCDPWQAYEFLENMQTVPGERCSYCLPDCSLIMYDVKITTVPMKSCDQSNFGISSLCNTSNNEAIQPALYGNQIYSYYKYHLGKVPDFILNKISSSNSRSSDESISPDSAPSSYEAYVSDIAKVEIFFKTSSVIQVGSQPTMTWVDFFSNIGGILGLVLGMGMISIFEIFWLGIRIFAKKLQLTNWVL